MHTRTSLGPWHHFTYLVLPAPRNSHTTISSSSIRLDPLLELHPGSAVQFVADGWMTQVDRMIYWVRDQAKEVLVARDAVCVQGGQAPAPRAKRQSSPHVILLQLRMDSASVRLHSSHRAGEWAFQVVGKVAPRSSSLWVLCS